MSLRMEAHVLCDRCKQTEAHMVDPPTQIRIELMNVGWSFTSGEDICPVCTRAELS